MGNIKFSNVKFRYPARNDVQVLNGLNLEIEAGKTVALVGKNLLIYLSVKGVHNYFWWLEFQGNSEEVN